MDLNKAKSLEKLRLEYKKVKDLPTIKKKIARLSEIITLLEDLRGPVKKIKLLSSEGDRNLKNLLAEMKNEQEKYIKEQNTRMNLINNIIDKKLDPEKIRNKVDYIKWYGEQAELEKLFLTMIEEDCILKLPPYKVKAAIKDHFYITEHKRTVKKKPLKIWWGRQEALLVHLFEILYSREKVKADFYSDKFINISNHFLNKKGNPLKNKQLENQYKQATEKTYDNLPLDHEKIDDVIKIVFNDKAKK